MRKLVHYFAQATDDCKTAWNVIKVYQDGSPIKLSGPYDNLEMAETMAEFHEVSDDFKRKMKEMEKAIEAFRALVRQYQRDIEELQNG